MRSIGLNEKPRGLISSSVQLQCVLKEMKDYFEYKIFDKDILVCSLACSNRAKAGECYKEWHFTFTPISDRTY